MCGKVRQGNKAGYNRLGICQVRAQAWAGGLGRRLLGTATHRHRLVTHRLHWEGRLVMVWGWRGAGWHTRVHMGWGNPRLWAIRYTGCWVVHKVGRLLSTILLSGLTIVK